MGFQPLPERVSPSEVKLDPEALRERPEIAKAVATVIGHWSQIDVQLVVVVAGFLNADFEVAQDMLNAIHNSGARREAIVAAANRALADKPDDLRLFQAVVKCVASARGMRNAYAHWLWGHTPALEDKLVLVEPIGAAEMGAELFGLLLGPGWGSPRRETNPSITTTVDEVLSKQRERYHVVSQADVERDIRDAVAAHEWMSALLRLLVWSRAEPEEGDIARLQLLAVDRIREAYDQLSPTENTP